MRSARRAPHDTNRSEPRKRHGCAKPASIPPKRWRIRRRTDRQAVQTRFRIVANVAEKTSHCDRNPYPRKGVDDANARAENQDRGPCERRGAEGGDCAALASSPLNGSSRARGRGVTGAGRSCLYPRHDVSDPRRALAKETCNKCGATYYLPMAVPEVMCPDCGERFRVVPENERESSAAGSRSAGEPASPPDRES
jgi:DNA-directed RNA polymerase subunit RPC12/RpoP